MKFFLRHLAVLAVAVSVSLGLHAQITPRNLTPLTLSGSTVAASTTTVITSQSFTPKAGAGFAVVPTFVLSGSGTSNITFSFAVSVDGINWSTTTPFTYAVAATGTTPVTGFCNFPAPIAGNGADNILYVRLQSVTNGNSGSSLTISGVNITHDN